VFNCFSCAACSLTLRFRIPGTIYSAAKEVEAAGGRALPIAVDIRSEAAVEAAVARAVAHFGGIDILINNASAISLTGTSDTTMKRFDLMHSVNARGTFMVTQKCLPHLQKSSHAHVLNISPPLNMETKWFSPHCAYTIAKYGVPVLSCAAYGIRDTSHCLKACPCACLAWLVSLPTPLLL
jgi:citronellol/citronellal dehydrogenase